MEKVPPPINFSHDPEDDGYPPFFVRVAPPQRRLSKIQIASIVIALLVLANFAMSNF